MHSFLSTQRANYAFSSSCGTYSLTTTSETDVTNLSVSLTVSGNAYVWVGLVADGSGSESFIRTYNDQNSITQYNIYRGATRISINAVRMVQATGGNTTVGFQSGAGIRALDRPAAGTYTYKVTAQNFFSSRAEVSNLRLLAVELNF